MRLSNSQRFWQFWGLYHCAFRIHVSVEISSTSEPVSVAGTGRTYVVNVTLLKADVATSCNSQATLCV